MSIIRLSCIKDTIYAPHPNGNLDADPYRKRQRRGKMERLEAPAIAPASAKFRHYLQGEIGDKAPALGEGQPVLVMVHGFLFDPKQAVSPDPKETDNPHGRLYHFVDGDEREEQRHHTSSWPRWLGFDQEDGAGASGLAVGFGWHSQPGFASSLIDHFKNFYARAYEIAGQTAWVLVNVLDELARTLPGHRLDLLAHSLGSRVVVRAIALAAKHHPGLVRRLGRVIFLGGAEYVVEAQLMYRRVEDLGGADGPVFYNVVSRENDVLDTLGENFGPRTFGKDQVIGHNGLDVRLHGDPARRPRNWMDLQIDSRSLQEWMSDKRGLEVSGDRPGNVWDHWYYYTFRRNMDLYRGILRDPDGWTLDTLRAEEIPEGVAKRWFDFGD